MDCPGCLEREDAVAERPDLLVGGQGVARSGDPADRQANEPFNELRGGTWPCSLAEESWCWGGSAGDVLPLADGWGVASPESKKPSINANVALGGGRSCETTSSIT